jgi:hypothetical protein
VLGKENVPGQQGGAASLPSSALGASDEPSVWSNAADGLDATIQKNIRNPTPNPFGDASGQHEHARGIYLLEISL